MSIITKITQLLDSKKLSQKDLTDYLGIDKSTFSQWKNGRSKSYAKYITDIAEFLDTTPSYLMGWTDDPIDYEKTDENLNAPLDAIERFNGDDKKIYEFMKANEEDAISEQSTPDRVTVLARHLKEIPECDRDQLIDTLESTIDVYLRAKGLK